MEVNLETPGGLQRDLRITIPADRVAKVVGERLKNLSRRAKLPGFRPGKAPMKVIEQQYGPSAHMDAVSELVQTTYPEALKQSGVRPVGQPKINVTSEKPGQALEYVASIEVFPEIEFKGLEEIEVEAPVVEITDADVDRLVESLRKGKREINPVDRACASGDIVKIDYEGKVDGEAFEGGKAEGSEVELGLGQFIADLESGIAGHSAGETFDVPVTFPEDYRAEALRGKAAVFTVTLHEVKEIVLPALDDAEFLKAHSVETVDQLRAKGQEALEKERGKAIQRRQKESVMAQLVEKNPTEVPQALVDQEIPKMREQTLSRMNMGGQVPQDKIEEMLPGALFEDNAKRRVALGLLMGELIRQREIQLDEDRFETTLDQMAADYEEPEQVKAYYRSRPETLEGIRSLVLEDQVVDMLLDSARKVDTPMSLELLLNPPPPVPPAKAETEAKPAE